MNFLRVTTITAAAVTVMATGVLPGTLRAQSASARQSAEESLPRFEASIKRSQDNAGFIAFRSEPAGRTMNGVPLRQLIVQSYGIQQNQLVGGPEWIGTDRWDIQLRADTPVTPAQANLLLQRLMAERFKLVIHREMRELPIFELRMARADGRPGPDLKPSSEACGPQGLGRRGDPASPAPDSLPRGGAVVGRGGAGRGQGPLGGCGMMLAPGRIEGNGQPVTQLSNFLSNQLGRLVVDKTGLTGGFDFVLSWTPDGPGRGALAPPPGIQLPPIDPNGPPLVTALQEQLGLKLESTRGSVEVLVIDSVQQPSEN
jgi:uncharacterized protein (TIGR03435 family)